MPYTYTNVLTVMDANVCSDHMGINYSSLTAYSLYILYITDFLLVLTFCSYLKHIFSSEFGELLHLVGSKQRERKKQER